jgi:glutamyl-tRNA synthetase
MVRVRIAPSPTGDPHVGTAYIALFNYVFAKKHGGEFVLRIEDTDKTRSRPEWEQMILEALRWTGLSWDEGPDVGGPHAPYRQSERGGIYKEHAESLVERGGAYRCFCTAERLEQVRKEQREKKVPNPGYDGCCRALDAATVAAKLRDGVPHVIRLKVPKDGNTVVKDRLRDEVSIENTQVDDQVLLKTDGMPTYHLANVVDDHLMAITHVIRAEEWITSTPKHVLLYRAFGWAEPEWIHMPLLRNPGGAKISKRKNPVSLNYYRDAGFLPEALLNYLARMGWSMPDDREKFTVAEMIEAFTFDRLSLGGPVFDLAKLTWLNGLYLRELSPERLVERLRESVFSQEKLAAIAPLLQERVEKLEDFVDKATYFFNGDLTYDAPTLAAMVPKKREAKDAVTALKAVLEVIDALPTVTAVDLEAKLRAVADTMGWKAKDLFMPLRVAVTGRSATPPLFETMAVLGKERCRRRLRGALAQLEATPPQATTAGAVT